MLPWLTILAIVVALFGTTHSCIAEENLEPRLADWRDRSTAISGGAARALIERQFTVFDPRYLEQRGRFAPQISAAAALIRKHEERGRSLACSTQIYLEAKSLANYTALFDELSGMLESFRDSLGTDDQSFANLQSAADGGWGACYRRKFKRFGRTAARKATICTPLLS